MVTGEEGIVVATEEIGESGEETEIGERAEVIATKEEGDSSIIIKVGHLGQVGVLYLELPWKSN
jgi:hypothetical protein